MIARACAVWVALLALAFANGALRELAIIPQLGDGAGHALSSILLSSAMFLLAWLTIDWIHPASIGEAWQIGGVWLVMTVAFEFLAGHYLFGNPWSQLLADYNVLRGRIWVLVLATTLMAPVITARITVPLRTWKSATGD